MSAQAVCKGSIMLGSACMVCSKCLAELRKLPPRTYEQQVEALGVVGLFAPGSYVSPCHSCRRTFIGDKRARQCLPCAVASLKAQLEETQALKITADY